MNIDPALALGAFFLGLGGLLLFVRGMFLLSRRARADETMPRIHSVDAVDDPLATLADRERYEGQV